MKKILFFLISAMLVLLAFPAAFADGGSEPDGTRMYVIRSEDKDKFYEN